MRRVTPEQIDELLPQTQCGLCGYGGCLPYAEALVFENATINLCPPGGVKTLKAIGELLKEDPAPYLSEMEQKAKPKLLAVIREDECIGCTKCIQACPVDAILGSSKQMHAVVNSECTGCELCVSPCPVDCIDMVPVAANENAEAEKLKADYFRDRFQARQKRLEAEKEIKQVAKVDKAITVKKNYIQDAIARAKTKKLGL